MTKRCGRSRCRPGKTLSVSTIDRRLLPLSVRYYLPVRKLFPGGRELSKLVADHLVRDANLLVRVAIVDHETQSDEVGNDGAGASLGEDGRVVTESLLQRGEGGEVGAYMSAIRSLRMQKESRQT